MTNVKRQAPPPHLLNINGRQMTSDGKFHANLLADELIRKNADIKARNKWMSLRDGALVMYRSGVTSNQEKIRVRLGKLADELKARGFCLVVEPATYNFKVYEGTDIEKQYVQNKHGFWEARARKAEEWRDYLEGVDQEEGRTE